MAKSQKLVIMNTPTNELDNLIKLCLKDDQFEVKNADEFISKTMGYERLKQENPYAELLSMTTQILEYGFDITSKVHDMSVINNEEAQRYLIDIKTKFDKLKSEQEMLEHQLNECEKAIESYQHFKELNLDLGKIFACEFIAMRFGHLSFESYKKLQSVYGDNPYFMFTICSEDKTGYWGAYFAPRDKVEEIDSIFVVLNFNRLYVHGASGTLAEVGKTIRENIKIISEQKLEINCEIETILSKHSGEIVSMYFSLLSLDEIFNYKRYAIKNSKDSFFVGVIPVKYEEEFLQKVQVISNIFVNTEKYKEKKRKK